jgi:hypothetical protein
MQHDIRSTDAYRSTSLSSAAVLIAPALAVLAIGIGVDGALANTSDPPSARSARVISVRDSSELHLVRAIGETLLEEGKTTGTLPGTVRTRIDLNAGAGTATSRFTFYLTGGSLTGRASGVANSGQGGWESFAGTMWLDRGTGRYAHASGSGKMYGALYRRNDRLKVQAIGRLRY